MDKLEKKIIIKGKIESITGLIIGGTNSSLGIGGPDNMVIRNPKNNEPYIPGSSLKGKMRSLSEITHGLNLNYVTKQVPNGPSNDRSKVPPVLFGTSSQDENQRPSRILVRDAYLYNSSELENLDTDLPYTESKAETVIDRITSKATPRQFERVPAGAKFNFELVINIFHKDQLKESLLPQTLSALQMVQDDYLGGSGSRGSGQVKFYIESVKERPASYYQGQYDTEEDITNSCQLPDELV